ncbi:hypothetical protein GCM10009716_17580 [Streptomyces sodiiphilus]|uniref:Uncharacterized protein n=1 Tax=Streptomyces sodiiphilus TaxID=226217 RepID=A0ABP5ACF9_9ACTN
MLPAAQQLEFVEPGDGPVDRVLVPVQQNVEIGRGGARIAQEVAVHRLFRLIQSEYGHGVRPQGVLPRRDLCGGHVQIRTAFRFWVGTPRH